MLLTNLCELLMFAQTNLANQSQIISELYIRLVFLLVRSAADCQPKVQERRLEANSVTDMTEFSSRLSGGKNGLIKWLF